MSAGCGIGLRAPHHREVIRERPAVAWFEAHSENYFADGGWAVECLSAIRADYPIALHGVGLSLGSTDALDAEHLKKLSRAVTRFAPLRVSEHLSWSSVGGRFANDLLPLPYTEEALRHVSLRIAQTQDALGRQILIENVSSYLTFAASTWSEVEFLAAVAAESGCGILLDLNNVYVSAHNHGFDAAQYLQALPRAAVQEFHLAGHAVAAHGGLLIDTHDAPVCAPVWELYRLALQHFGDVPTLIEWDANLPTLAVLCAEAARADTLRAEFARAEFGPTPRAELHVVAA